MSGTGFIGTMFFGMVAVKLIAVVAGPAGIGLFSLLRQFQQTASLVGSYGGQTALVQGLSSRDGKDRENFLAASATIFMVTGGLVTLAILAFAPQISRVLSNSQETQSVVLVRWMALPTLIGVALAFLNGVLNGHRAIGQLAIVQVVAAACIAAGAYPASLWVRQGLPIAFAFLLAIAMSVAVTYGTWVCWRSGWLSPLLRPSDGLRVPTHARGFLQIASSTLFSGLMSTGAALFIRALVVKKEGLAAAGIFDVAWTLSMVYVMIVLTSLGNFYLPTLSGTQTREGRVTLIEQLLRFCIMTMVPLVVTVIVLKPLVIEVLYSSQFNPSLNIMRWMLIGDYLKVGGWVLAVPMIAFADTRSFFWSELLANSTLMGLAAISVLCFSSLQGIGLSFLVMYFLYGCFMVAYVRRCFSFRMPTRTLFAWCAGLLLIAAASFYTWEDTAVRWPSALMWIFVSLSSPWFCLRSTERLEIKQTLYKAVRR